MIRRTLLLLVSHVAILVLGLALGAWVAVDRVIHANAVLEDIGTIERMSSYVHAQRTLGDGAAYEAALNDLLSALKRRQSDPGPISDEKVLATDVALTHARLALLAEERGDMGNAKKHFDEAVGQCPSAFLKACTTDDLRRVVLEIDTQPSGANGRVK
jgi:hypothetical protein